MLDSFNKEEIDATIGQLFKYDLLVKTQHQQTSSYHAVREVRTLTVSEHLVFFSQ